MNQFLNVMYKTALSSVTISIALALLATAFGSESISIENQCLRVVLRDDLNGFSSIVDKQTGRNYAANTPESLYKLHIGTTLQSAVEINSLTSKTASFNQDGNKLELRYIHEGDIELEVICRASLGADSNKIY